MSVRIGPIVEFMEAEISETVEDIPLSTVEKFLIQFFLTLLSIPCSGRFCSQFTGKCAPAEKDDAPCWKIMSNLFSKTANEDTPICLSQLQTIKENKWKNSRR